MKLTRIKQVEVQIMGQPYTLACPPDGEAALHAAVAKVDEAMCRIRDIGKVKARDRIAVLALLNLAYELTQNEQKPPTLTPTQQAQVQSLLDRMDQVLPSSDPQA